MNNCLQDMQFIGGALNKIDWRRLSVGAGGKINTFIELS